MTAVDVIGPFDPNNSSCPTCCNSAKTAGGMRIVARAVAERCVTFFVLTFTIRGNAVLRFTCHKFLRPDRGASKEAREPALLVHFPVRMAMAQLASSASSNHSASSSASTATKTEIQTFLSHFDAQINTMMDYPAKDTINALTIMAERIEFAPEIVSFLETKIHRVMSLKRALSPPLASLFSFCFLLLKCISLGNALHLISSCGTPRGPISLATSVRTRESDDALVAPNCKLPIFYLTDSILKNVRGPYLALFATKIVPLYCNCVRQVSNKDLQRFLHVLNTWETSHLFPKDAIECMRNAAIRVLQGIDAFGQTCMEPRRPIDLKRSTTKALEHQDVALRTLLTKLQNDMGIHPTEHMSLEEVRLKNPDYYHQLLAFQHTLQDDESFQKNDRKPNQLQPRTTSVLPTQPLDTRTKSSRLSPVQSSNVAHLMQLLKRKQRPKASLCSEETHVVSQPPNAAAVMSILQKLKTLSKPSNALETSCRNDSFPRIEPSPRNQETGSRMWFSDKIVDCKDRVESNVQKLYAALPLVCRASGLRFREQAQLDAHLDFLFQYNRARKERGKGGISRSWYLDETHWVVDFSGATAPRESTSSSFFDQPPVERTTELPTWEKACVPVDETITRCRICGESFSTRWDEDEEEWMYTNAIVGAIHDTMKDGIKRIHETIFHKYCYDTVRTNSTTITSAHLIPLEVDGIEEGDDGKSKDLRDKSLGGVKRTLNEVDCESDGDDDLKRVKGVCTTKEGGNKHDKAMS
ncbi:hypothetical protein CCR75_004431 [Bremia lactucae]|uniref:CID domain-containing protein n=1 Tax=Bremia lactucae TaxID=4779 RepID=A0A976IIB5_BRELC|nr:hypothetical protein CCR75_004431 [Bremia lactucae]